MFPEKSAWCPLRFPALTAYRYFDSFLFFLREFRFKLFDYLLANARTIRETSLKNMLGTDCVCSKTKTEGTTKPCPHGELVLCWLPPLPRAPDEDDSFPMLWNSRLLGPAAHTRKQMGFAEPVSQPDFLGDNFLKTQ